MRKRQGLWREPVEKTRARALGFELGSSLQEALQSAVESQERARTSGQLAPAFVENAREARTTVGQLARQVEVEFAHRRLHPIDMRPTISSRFGGLDAIDERTHAWRDAVAFHADPTRKAQAANPARATAPRVDLCRWRDVETKRFADALARVRDTNFGRPHRSRDLLLEEERVAMTPFVGAANVRPAAGQRGARDIGRRAVQDQFDDETQLWIRGIEDIALDLPAGNKPRLCPQFTHVRSPPLSPPRCGSHGARSINRFKPKRDGLGRLLVANSWIEREVAIVGPHPAERPVEVSLGRAGRLRRLV